MAALQAIRVRPAVWAALPLVGGIAAYRILPSYPALWIASCLLAIAGAALLHHLNRPVASCACIALAIALAGVAETQLRAFAYPGDYIGQYTSNEPRLACMKLRIAEPPRVAESARSWMMPPREVCDCQALAIRTAEGWKPASGTVQLSLAQVMPTLSAGDTVLAVGSLGRPAGPMNPGQFDEAEQLRQRGILAELDVRHDSAVQLLSPGHAPILPALRDRAEALLDSGFIGDRAIDGALLQALVLGRRPSSLHEVEDEFSSAGVMHLLASNGARIAVLAAFVYLFGRLLGLHPRWLVSISAAAALLYGCLTSSSPQTIRPVLLCAAVGIALAGRRRVDSVQLLACAAIALLVAQPMDLFAAGFQLSFVTVLALMLLTPSARRAWLAMEDPDERVLASFGRLSPIRVGWQAVRRKIMALVALAVIAWAAAMPLVAYHFQQINPYSVPMGLALSPMVFACLAAGVVKIAFTAAVPGLASVWAAKAAVPIDALRHAVHAAAKLPGSDLPIATPSAGWLFVWYAALAACALPIRARASGRVGPRRWLSASLKIASPATGAILLIAPMTGMKAAPPSDRPMRITLLAVGAGQCAVIEAPDGKATLIDAGSTSMSQMMRQVLEPFLRYEGRRRVARLVLSNNAADRVSAADEVIADCDMPAVFTSTAVSRSIGENWRYAGLLNYLDRHGNPASPIRAGQTIDLGDGATLSALWPADSTMTGVNAGLVMKLCYAGRAVLFTGDIAEPAEAALEKQPAMLSADVMVAPHQGNFDASSADLVAAADPAIVLSSDASELTEKQLHYADAVGNRPLLRTGQCGAITITIRGDGTMSIEPFLPFGDNRRRQILTLPAGQRRVDAQGGRADHHG